MAFRLKKNEGASVGARRIAREEIEEAIELTGDSDSAEAVPEIRKRLKKVRAVVRLVRGELGEEIFRRENAT